MYIEGSPFNMKKKEMPASVLITWLLEKHCYIRNDRKAKIAPLDGLMKLKPSLLVKDIHILQGAE